MCVKTPLATLICILTFATFAPAQESERAWTSSDGKQLTGTLESFDGTNVQIRTSKAAFKFPLARLSEADQQYIKAWAANKPVSVGAWPEFVEVPLDLPVQTITEEEGNCVYRSPHFEFRAPIRLSQSVIREFARIFEATFEAVKALPVGFDPKPNDSGFFVTELYRTKEDYYAAGGPEGSGGVYKTRDDKIMIPLEFLGVKAVGNRFILEARGDNDVLKHEIAHQVTRRWLLLSDVWFVEGLAEYIAAARYKDGRYTFKNIAGSVEEYVFKRTSDAAYPMLPVDSLLKMSFQEWAAALTGTGMNRNYPSANLLMFYFLHLDGDGKGTAVAEYLRALDKGEDQAAAMKKYLVRERQDAALSQDVRDKLRSVGIRVEFQ